MSSPPSRPRPALGCRRHRRVQRHRLAAPVDDSSPPQTQRGVPVLVDAAQLAAHRPPAGTGDYVAWSGHKMYAPFGSGVLIGPRDTFAEGDPFLAGGGAVDLVDLDEVVWTDLPDREEAGSPQRHRGRRPSRRHRPAHLHRLGRHRGPRGGSSPAGSRHGLAGIDGVRLLGPDHHVPRFRSPRSSSKASPTRRWRRASAPNMRSVCATAASAPTPTSPASSGSAKTRSPPTSRPSEPATAPRYPAPCEPAAGSTPGPDDIDRLLEAVAEIAHTPPPVPYVQDPSTGDYWPQTDTPGWSARIRAQVPRAREDDPSRCDSRLSELREGTPPMTLHFTRPQGPRSFW